MRRQLEAKFAWVNGELQDKPWLMGVHFSVADAYLYVVTRWAKALNLDVSALSHLQQWFARVEERPSVQAALKAEGLI